MANVDNLRCLNVRQPWASLIVEGIKPIENRLPGANKPYFSQRMNVGDNMKGEWVLIVSSTVKPTQTVLTEALHEMHHCYGREEGQRVFDRFMRRHASCWLLGCVVGVVRFSLLVTPQMREERPDVLESFILKWYRGHPYVGWYVMNAIVFNTPIPDISGVRSIARIQTKGTEIEGRIRNALRNMTINS